MCYCKCCQLDRQLDGTFLKFRSRKLVNESPIRKWPGMRTWRPLGSVEIGVSGRELRIDSISIMRAATCDFDRMIGCFWGEWLSRSPTRNITSWSRKGLRGWSFPLTTVSRVFCSGIFTNVVGIHDGQHPSRWYNYLGPCCHMVGRRYSSHDSSREIRPVGLSAIGNWHLSVLWVSV